MSGRKLCWWLFDGAAYKKCNGLVQLITGSYFAHFRSRHLQDEARERPKRKIPFGRETDSRSDRRLKISRSCDQVFFRSRMKNFESIEYFWNFCWNRTSRRISEMNKPSASWWNIFSKGLTFIKILGQELVGFMNFSNWIHGLVWWFGCCGITQFVFRNFLRHWWNFEIFRVW